MDNLIYCGFGLYYDKSSGRRLEKTASGELVSIDDGVVGDLERDFVQRGIEKKAAEKEGISK